MKTVIIGLGNPILSDDSIGIKASRVLANALRGVKGIDVLEAYAGGMRLMDVLAGYDRAVIIDAMCTGASPGTIRCFTMSGIEAARNSGCAHDMNLATALEMGTLLGLSLPAEITIWGIEAEDVTTFSEDLTEDVRTAVPDVVEQVMRDLEKTGHRREASSVANERYEVL